MVAIILTNEKRRLNCEQRLPLQFFVLLRTILSDDCVASPGQLALGSVLRKKILRIVKEGSK
jgi:hypothetical protein